MRTMLVMDPQLLVGLSPVMIGEVKLVEAHKVWVREPKEEKVVEEGGPFCQSMAMMGNVIAPLAPLEDGGADESSLATPSQ